MVVCAPAFDSVVEIDDSNAEFDTPERECAQTPLITLARSPFGEIL